MLTGSLVAIATPMRDDASLDLDAFRRLIEFHITEGTNGIVAVGTTGESPTVDFDEHCDLIRVAVEQVRGRVPVVAGTGANSTSEAIELQRYAKSAGANMALSVVPYYNKPSQEGLFQHFRAIAEAVDLPMILYNVPGRTVADLHNDTTVRLSQVRNIVGIKDATGNVERGADLLRRLPPNFAVYSGDDGSCLALMLLGGHGVISVTANVAPRAMREMCDAALAGNLKAARAINDRLMGLHKNLFLEANPIPVKWVLQQMGLVGPGLRLPMTPLASQYHAALRDAMRQAGIVSALAPA
jgi:4-hydroxy-tetrahydrodipicolinate synthase